MKKLLSLLLAVALVLSFGVFALGSGSDNGTADQGSSEADATKIGEYSVVIDSCRFAKDYEKKDVIIVKYIFTNNADDAAAFWTTFEDGAFQNGVGLNEAYIMDDSANYNSDNQMKEIKKGATLDVEVAYTLNDNTTDVEIEVKELFSFSDKTLTKTFKIAK